MRKPLLILLAVVVVAYGAFVGVNYYKHHHHAGASAASIPASGNVELAATVVKPKGSGLHPLVVMPTAWGSKQSEYNGIAALFAEHGFVVVAYTQRGFNSSGGLVDFAGPTTVADVSTVIDWAIKHDSADPNHVGLLGQSYGAGVSLLAAEHDPRVKAVVALSTWTSWQDTFIENGTLVSRSLNSLIGSGSTPTKRLDNDISTLAFDFPTQPATAMSLIKSLSPERSPIDGVAALNKNKPAGLMANGVQDALLNPQQLLNMYDKLTGPKRIQFGTGDHGQVEARALVTGQAIGPVANALKWMQHYLQGQANGIESQAPIEVQDSRTGATRDLTAWPAATRKSTLALPVNSTNHATAAGQWTAYLGAGRISVVGAPLEQLTLDSPYRFTSVDLATLNPLYDLRWDEPVATSPQVIQGNSVVTLGLLANKSTASLFAYLYDVSPSGFGTMISATPLSVTGLSETVPKTVSLTPVPSAWTIPAGDHVALIVGGSDAKWTSISQVGEVLAVHASPSQPATLTLPIN